MLPFAIPRKSQREFPNKLFTDRAMRTQELSRKSDVGSGIQIVRDGFAEEVECQDREHDHDAGQ